MEHSVVLPPGNPRQRLFLTVNVALKVEDRILTQRLSSLLKCLTEGSLSCFYITADLYSDLADSPFCLIPLWKMAEGPGRSD